MKTIILPLFCLLISEMAHSQSGYIYKRNSFSGDIEIFQSTSGYPSGTPIASMKKNLWGYLEVKAIEPNTFTISQTQNSSRPELIPVQPYLAPVSDIINTTNAYYQLLNTKRQQQDKIDNVNLERGVQKMNEFYAPFKQKASTLKTFLNSLTDKPQTIQDGWHNVLIIINMNDAFATLMSGSNIKADNLGELGYAYVKGNKILGLVEQELSYKRYIFHGGNFVTGAIKNCQAYIKEGDNILEALFIDYAIDPQPLKQKPLFGSVTFNYPEQRQLVIIRVYDKSDVNRADPVGSIASIRNDASINNFGASPGKYTYTVQYPKDVNSSLYIASGEFEITDMSNQTILVK